MGDAEIVTLLISKMDDLKDDIKSVEEKIDRQSEKLSSFEIKASEVLAVHDCDIVALKLKVDILDKDLKEKEAKLVELSAASVEKSSNGFIKFLDSSVFNYFFRGLVLMFLSLILGIDKLKLLLPLLSGGK